MLTSLAFILLCGLPFAAIFGRLRLPRIIGMIAAGVLIGPSELDLLGIAVGAAAAR